METQSLVLNATIVSAQQDADKAIALLADAFGCFQDARAVACDVWLLGYWCGRACYYTTTPRSLEGVLATDRLAFFIYAGGPVGLPAEMAKRGRSLGQILKRDGNGDWIPVVDELQKIAPSKTAGFRHGCYAGGTESRVLVWTLALIEWYAELRRDRKGRRFRPPQLKWCAEYIRERAPKSVRLPYLSLRTLRRDLDNMRHVEPGTRLALLTGQFLLLWRKAYDGNFVKYHSQRLLSQVVESMTAHERAPHPDDLPVETHGRFPYREVS